MKRMWKKINKKGGGVALFLAMMMAMFMVMATTSWGASGEPVNDATKIDISQVFFGTAELIKTDIKDGAITPPVQDGNNIKISAIATGANATGYISVIKKADLGGMQEDDVSGETVNGVISGTDFDQGAIPHAKNAAADDYTLSV